jgi:hypothetical protein
MFLSRGSLRRIFTLAQQSEVEARGRRDSSLRSASLRMTGCCWSAEKSRAIPLQRDRRAGSEWQAAVGQRKSPERDSSLRFAQNDRLLLIGGKVQSDPATAGPQGGIRMTGCCWSAEKSRARFFAPLRFAQNDRRCGFPLRMTNNPCEGRSHVLFSIHHSGTTQPSSWQSTSGGR